MMASGPGVVIGFDGSAASMRALEWAAGEAGLRRVPLTVCHVREDAAAVDPADAGLEDPVLARGVALACSQEWALHVVPRLVGGPPAAALLKASDGAEMLAAGTRGTGKWSWPGLGSVSEQLASRAACPLLLVPDDGIWRSGPVVVGVDGASSSQRVAGFAFDEAHLRHVPVLAVCWSPEPGEAERITMPWRCKYPDVAFCAVQAQEHPAAALRARADIASLLVVGARSDDDLPSMARGKVADELLENAAHPIALVR